MCWSSSLRKCVSAQSSMKALTLKWKHNKKLSQRFSENIKDSEQVRDKESLSFFFWSNLILKRCWEWSTRLLLNIRDSISQRLRYLIWFHCGIIWNLHSMVICTTSLQECREKNRRRMQTSRCCPRSIHFYACDLIVWHRCCSVFLLWILVLWTQRPRSILHWHRKRSQRRDHQMRRMHLTSSCKKNQTH